MQVPPGQGVQGMGLQEIGLAKVFDRPLDVLPTGVLDQHGPDHHFKRRLARPPMLGAQRVEQPAVDFAENSGHGKERKGLGIRKKEDEG